MNIMKLTKNQNGWNKGILLAILLLGLGTLLNAGNVPVIKGTIKGVVKEKGSNVPVEYANVVLYNKVDSSLVAVTITDENGNYALEKIPEGDYYMVFDFIGYKEKVNPNVKIDSKKSELELGSVTIEPDTELLEAVTVEARQNMSSTSVDKKVVNVKQNLTAKGGTAADALRNAPSITTDAENNVLLRGSMDYRVLINGKPTVMKAADVLKQTPADIIERIEIITNPSVKYSAEGTAGIINIILKSELARGFNGMVNATVGTKDKYSGNATINLNMEKVRLSAGVEWTDNTKTGLNSYEHVVKNGDTTNYGFNFQDRTHKDKNLGFRFNVDYSINKTTSIAYAANTGYVSFGADMTHNNHGYTQPASEVFYEANTFSLGIKPTFYTQNISLTHAFDEKGTSLSLNGYYSRIKYVHYNYKKTALSDANFNPVVDNWDLLNIDNENFSNDYRLETDFTLPLNEKTNFETGLSFHGYTRFIDVKFTEYDYNTANWLTDPTFTNQFDFYENIYAGYASINTELMGFKVNAGLRTEFMDRELFQKTNENAFPYSKWHVFPSFSASKELEKKQSIQLGYSHRINRPDEYMMNPFPEAQDRYFYSTGNPLLIPEISHSVELSYQKFLKKGSVSAQVYYKQTNDRIDQTITLMDDNRIFLMMDNNTMDQTIGSDLMANYNPTKWWSINTNASLYQYFVSGEVEGVSFNKNSFQWNAQVVNSLNFKTNTSFQIIAMYNSETIRSQGILSDFYMMNVAVNQTFFNKKLSVNLQAKDILQSMNYTLHTEHDNLNLMGYFNNESPILMLSISYTFNNFKKMTKDVETDFDM